MEHFVTGTSTVFRDHNVPEETITELLRDAPNKLNAIANSPFNPSAMGSLEKLDATELPDPFNRIVHLVRTHPNTQNNNIPLARVWCIILDFYSRLGELSPGAKEAYAFVQKESKAAEIPNPMATLSNILSLVQGATENPDRLPEVFNGILGMAKGTIASFAQNEQQKAQLEGCLDCLSNILQSTIEEENQKIAQIAE